MLLLVVTPPAWIWGESRGRFFTVKDVDFNSKHDVGTQNWITSLTRRDPDTVDPEAGYDPWDLPEWSFRFLTVLAQTGLIRHSLDIAGVNYETYNRLRQRDVRFADAADEAMKRSGEFLELVARERAVQGGSDRLLIELLRANVPSKFRQPIQPAQQSGTSVAPVIGYQVLPPANTPVPEDGTETGSETETLEQIASEPAAPFLSNGRSPDNAFPGEDRQQQEDSVYSTSRPVASLEQ